ncbi:MAG: SufE family protein [Oligoflexales bacterium]|nr:SufE family protein [Oligoflexales bacterium]
METFEQKKQAVVESLSKIEDYQQRLQFLIEKGKNMPKIDPQFKMDHFLVPGCISRVWLVPQFKNSSITFHADADSLIVKGIVALLLSVYNDSAPSDIMKDDGGFLVDVGVTQHLSVNRRNGLAHVLKQIHAYAGAFQKQTQKENLSLV